METELIKELNGVLKAFPQFWDGEKLHRSMVIEAINQKEPTLIKVLINNDKIKSLYSTDIEGILIFDFDKLTNLLKYKEFWNDSFTKYRNTVGLTSEGKYLNYNSDVVLDFPFKDCVLEGGMTKEDQGKDEIYYNEVIARDEIDRLFSPKVFTNTKRYTKDGIEENIIDFNDEDNLIIKGNNLIALHSLKERYAGKVKLIYIDPPYNTGNDSFKYNDRFNHSTWLTFMKNRLEVARDLLSNDGVIFINTDEKEHAYIKILCDEIFGRINYVGDLIWRKRKGGGNDSHFIALDHDYISIFTKDSSRNIHDEAWRVSYEDIYLKRYKEKDEITGKRYYWDTLARNGLKNPIKVTIETPDGEGLTFNSQKPKNTILKELETGSIKFSKGRNGWTLHHRVYQPEGRVLRSILNLFSDLPTNKDAKDEMIDLYGDDKVFSNPKPERLIKQIIELVTVENDIVLDFHLGSGTTCAVAHKMGRRYIGIEQMDYINEITVPRLQKVIDGEQGGISKDIEWQGGGSFVYVELMELNYQFINKIENANDYEALKAIFTEMKDNAHLNYQADLNKVLKASYEMDGMPRLVSFEELELHEQKKLLIELLDKNQLYVSHSEIKDKTLNVSEADQAFNHSFYEKD